MSSSTFSGAALSNRRSMSWNGELSISSWRHTSAALPSSSIPTSGFVISLPLSLTISEGPQAPAGPAVRRIDLTKYGLPGCAHTAMASPPSLTASLTLGICAALSTLVSADHVAVALS